MKRRETSSIRHRSGNKRKGLKRTSMTREHKGNVNQGASKGHDLQFILSTRKQRPRHGKHDGRAQVSSVWLRFSGNDPQTHRVAASGCVRTSSSGRPHFAGNRSILCVLGERSPSQKRQTKLVRHRDLCGEMIVTCTFNLSAGISVNREQKKCVFEAECWAQCCCFENETREIK